MSVTEKIDKYLSENTKKKLVKEDFEASDVNADIIELLNSLDDSLLDDYQLELKDRILSANEPVEATEEYDDDIVVDIDEPYDPDLNTIDSAPLEPGLDDIIDDDVYEEKKIVKKTTKKKVAKK